MALGGSKKRRAIIPEYKLGRKPVKLNRNYEFELDNPEENKLYQATRIRDYLNDLPIHQIILDDIEADDVLSYITQLFPNDRKIIASNDRDFIQLLNENTIVYNTAKKVFITSVDAKKEYCGITPKNFALARAITGDKSDNLKGVGGVGLITLVKLFPFFIRKERIELEEFFNFCEKQEDIKYKKFLEKKDLIENNYKVMRLDTILIGFNSTTKIIECLNEKLSLNSTAFRTRLMDDGMLQLSESYFQPFRIILNRENEKL